MTASPIPPPGEHVLRRAANWTTAVGAAFCLIWPITQRFVADATGSPDSGYFFLILGAAVIVLSMNLRGWASRLPTLGEREVGTQAALIITITLTYSVLSILGTILLALALTLVLPFTVGLALNLL